MKHVMRAIIPLLSLLILVTGVAAQGPRFTVDTAAATHNGAKLIAFADGRLRMETDGVVDAAPVALRQGKVELPSLPTRHFVLLTNGDRLPLDPDAAALLEDGRVRVWPAFPELRMKGVSIFGPYLVLLFWSIPDGIDDAELFIARLQKETRKRDVVHLKNGDQVEGTITALTAKDGCTLTTATRDMQIPWPRLAGIAWNTERQARPRTKKTYWRAALDGGARLNLLDVRFDEKTRRWSGATQFGPTLDLPEPALLALDVRQGSAVDLADLTPTKFEHRPYLGVAWPLGLDASATGHFLRLAGSSYERGLGMHAGSSAAYKLDGQYQRFLGLVGINERARRGRAKVAVILDGKRIDLNDGKELTHDTPPIAVHLDLADVRALTLVVEPGAFGDVQANVDWASVRLIKK